VRLVERKVALRAWLQEGRLRKLRFQHAVSDDVYQRTADQEWRVIDRRLDRGRRGFADMHRLTADDWRQLALREHRAR
jgi:hypothetical protein